MEGHHHDGSVRMAFSPDGKRVKTIDPGGICCCWDADTGEILNRGQNIEPVDHIDPEYYFRRASISHDGKYAYVYNRNNTAYVWDTDTGDIIGILSKPPGNTQEGQSRSIFDGLLPQSGPQPRGACVICSIFDGAIALIYIGGDKDSEVMCYLIREWGNTSILATLSPDGQYVVAIGSRLAGGDGMTYTETIHIWDVASGRTVWEPLEHDSTSIRSLTSIAVSPNSQCYVMIMSYRLLGTIQLRLWDIGTRRQIGELGATETEQPSCVAFFPDSVQVAVGTYTSTVLIWDTVENVIKRRVSLLGTRVESIAISHDGASAAIANAEGIVRLFRTESGPAESMPVYNAQADDTSTSLNWWDLSLAFSPSGNRLVTFWMNSEGAIFQQYNIELESKLTMPLSHVLPVDSSGRTRMEVSFSSDARYMVVASVLPRTQIRLFDTDNSSEDYLLAIDTVAENDLPALEFNEYWCPVVVSDDGAYIVATFRSFICIWETSTRTWVKTLPLTLYLSGSPHGMPHALVALRLAPGGDMICFVIKSFGEIRVCIWNLESDHVLQIELIHNHYDGLTLPVPLAFSLDGTVIAHSRMTMMKEEIFLRDTRTGILLRRLQHKDPVLSIVFHPKGKYLISGGSDRTVRIWNLESGREICPPLMAHFERILCVTCSQDGRRMASASADGVIRIWDISILCAASDDDNTGQGSARKCVSIEERGTVEVHNIPFGWLAEMFSLGFGDAMTAHAAGSPVSPPSSEPLVDELGYTSCPDPRFLCKLSDGWMLGPKGERLIWIPVENRRLLWHPANTLVVPTEGSTEIDWDGILHGSSWSECYDGGEDEARR
jgi:WD40 repeat protein